MTISHVLDKSTGISLGLLVAVMAVVTVYAQRSSDETMKLRELMYRNSEHLAVVEQRMNMYEAMYSLLSERLDRMEEKLDRALDARNLGSNRP